jgi:hypothetical protein
MKKILLAFLCITIFAGLVACSSGSAGENTSSDEENELSDTSNLSQDETSQEISEMENLIAKKSQKQHIHPFCVGLRQSRRHR